MIDEHVLFEIHRFHHEGWSNRKIAKKPAISRETVKKYLADPVIRKPVFQRSSKLEPFRDEIGRLLELDPKAGAQVILQRITPLGFDGGITILKDYLRQVRPDGGRSRAYIRFESPAGEQIQVDWGHFGSLTYGNTSRKLYCMGMIESYSRMLYLEFTHSQRQEALHRAILNGFIFFQGAPGRLVHDNMLTAVIERDGPLIRFNAAFLAFLRPFKTVPQACNVNQPQEKGKIEKGAIHYIRNNFWPLRSFTDLADLQAQADDWRDNVANVRVHGTTGEVPVQRFRPDAMIALPGVLPDCRDIQPAKVHKDFSVKFDANTYSVPPSLVGRNVVVKADHRTVTIYYNEEPVATHERSWQRRLRTELPAHRQQVRENAAKQRQSREAFLLMSLGEEVKNYLERLGEENRMPLSKSIQRLLDLKDEYGAPSLIEAIQQATANNAYGADYIENILYQNMTPKRKHFPVKLREDALNRIRLEEPSLAEYDAFVIQRRKSS